MKKRQIIVIVFSVIAVATAVCLALIAYWQRPLPALQDGSKFISAVRAFTQEKLKNGQPMPDTLALWELVNSGFLAAEDARAFEGMEVTFYLTADLTRPKETVIRVRLPDGSQMVMLADGTVQQTTK